MYVDKGVVITVVENLQWRSFSEPKLSKMSGCGNIVRSTRHIFDTLSKNASVISIEMGHIHKNVCIAVVTRLCNKDALNVLCIDARPSYRQHLPPHLRDTLTKIMAALASSPRISTESMPRRSIASLSE